MFTLIRRTKVNNHTLSHQIGIFHTYAGAKRVMTRLMKANKHASFTIERDCYYNTCVISDTLTQLYYSWQDYRYARLVKKSRRFQRKAIAIKKKVER